MIGFPGRIFSDRLTPLDGGPADLTQETVPDYPHRSMVSWQGTDLVGQVWLLDDDAAFSAIPESFVSAANRLVSAGRSILILSRQPEPGADVRDGLLAALEAFHESDDEAQP